MRIVSCAHARVNMTLIYIAQFSLRILFSADVFIVVLQIYDWNCTSEARLGNMGEINTSRIAIGSVHYVSYG